MIQSELTHQRIVDALVQSLEPLEYVLAFWEAGAASFDRVDEWSDIDLMVVAEDDRVDDTMYAIERALAALTPIDIKYEIPQPSWHGHAQTFYRLQGVSPFLFVDICVMKLSSQEKFLQPELHGKAVIRFDKAGITENIPPLDPAKELERLDQRRAALKVTFDLFQVLVDKELNRRNWMEALAYYHGVTLRPLVEALRMRYDPARSAFYARYLYYDFPPEIVSRLEPLFFIDSPEDLRVKHKQAQQWFWDAICG